MIYLPIKGETALDFARKRELAQLLMGADVFVLSNKGNFVHFNND